MKKYYSSADVQKLIKSELKDFKFVVVSNREPYIHMHSPDGIKCKLPTGGLTAALDPAMQACGGLWIAGGSGDADRQTVDENNRVQVPPKKPKYTLRRVWMSKEEVDRYYFGFSNQALWPLCHNVFQKPSFKKEFWDGYKHSNGLFVDALIDEIKDEKAFVWFQDYHLALAPGMVRDSVGIKSAHFWHIPWPPWEKFALCPWADEILEGLLGNDLIGFHLKSYCVNFLESIEKILDADVDQGSGLVKYGGRKIMVKPFPISVDFGTIDRFAKRKKVEKEIKKVRSASYKFIGVGVDRVDYTKGIPERFLAIERFLEKYPGYQNNFVFYEAGAPSRTMIPTYKKLDRDIKKLVESINWKYQRGYWKPIRYLEGKLEYEKLLALYRTSDVCIISPLHDGMNLVAKEFVAANVENTGVLILSKFAGAGEELKDAVLVNPYDVEEFADAIKHALDMPNEEKENRMKNLRLAVKRNNVYRWIRDFISEAVKVL